LRIRGNLARDKDVRAGRDGLRLATSSALHLNAKFQICKPRSQSEVGIEIISSGVCLPCIR
jgi:hypothetical protein